MDSLVVDENHANNTMKDDKPVKVNGDMNGSIEGMEVDEDSNEGDGADVVTDESVYGSSRATIQDGDGDPEDPNSRFGSDIDGKSTSHFESEGEGKQDSEADAEEKIGSQFGSEYGAKSESHNDGLEEDGEDDAASVNSEEEEDLLNSDNEKSQNKSENNGENTAEGGDGEGESEEEGDINGPDDDETTVDDDKDEDKIKEETEEKVSPEARNGQVTPKKGKSAGEPITPRRSSRAVQKPVRFGQDHGEDDDEEDGDASDDVDDSIDPLADTVDKENHRFPRMIGNTTIVVSDGKKLADIASHRAQSKKEPTLVIIDTNSIMAGKSGVPMQTAGGVTITQTSSAQRAQASPPKPKPPTILPTLTDDMYVVEAPSFIVPYVYEKPPVKKFKKYLKKMLKEVRRLQDEEDKREEEEEKAEEDAKKAEAEGKKVKEEASEKMDVDKDDEKELKDKEKEDEEKKDEDSRDPPEVKKEPDLEIEADLNVKPDPDSPEKKKQSAEKDIKKEEKEESSESEDESAEEEDKKKPATGAGSYFDNPLGKFFMSIGFNQVQEFVQTDLLKQQKKKQKAGKGTDDTQQAINSLKKNLILSKESNEPYAMEQTKCEFCSFKTESKLIMAHHLETPHMRNYVYRCNFCPLEVRGPHDILFHMEAEHCVRGRLERAPAFHQCPQCPFEDNQKGKLTRHLMTCAKKFRPEKNLEPPPDWEPPAKIPRLPRKPNAMPNMNPMYSQALSKNIPQHLLPKVPGALAGANSPMMRAGRGRPVFPQMTVQQQKMLGQRAMPPQLQRGFYRNPAASSTGMLPSYPAANNPLYQAMSRQAQALNAAMPALQRLGIAPQPAQQKNPATVKLLNQPSISITPLPRQAGSNLQPGVPPIKPGSTAAANARTTFVICEICDGYIKDLEQLRNHMQWIHKVKIHPKMIYNRPPLNCQKCQFRFFTDQGLERHLLGSHGLVTSSMQDQANRGKDGGRCPVCGKVYQWKLLNHVARDHSMTLKPAHLSYKCTVCTATFGMYKQFESHVYSAHSVVAKRVMEKKNGQASTASTSRTDTASLLKPLKINDEITIIPQPAKKASSQRPVPGSYRVGSNPKSRGPDSVQVIDLEDSPNKGENGAESLTAVKERLKRRQSLEIRQLESEGEESGSDAEGEGDASSEAPAGKAQEDEPMDEDDQPTDGDSDE